MRQFSQTGLRTQAESPDDTYKKPLKDKHQIESKAEGCEGCQ